MKIVYVEKLNAASLAAIVLRGYAGSRVFFFEPGKSGQAWARLLKAMRILKAEPELIDFRLADLTDDHRGCQYLKITDDIRRLSFELCDHEISEHKSFKRLNSIFDVDSLLVFLSKSIAEGIHNTVIYLNVARHHALRFGQMDSPAVFLVEREFWSQRLCCFASELGLKANDYSAGISKFLYDFFGNLRKYAGVRSNTYLYNFMRRFSRSKGAVKKTSVRQESQTSNSAKKQPCLAAWYSGNTITFDLDKRSAIFWLLKTNFPREKVILYLSRTDVPVSDMEAGMLKQAGIECIALNSDARQSDAIPIWFPGKRCKHMNAALIKNLLIALVRGAGCGKFPSFFLIFNLFSFFRQYSYWLDFFKSHNVKIGFNGDDFLKTSVPRNLALKHCGGVSISYQYANLWVSAVNLSCYADIMFAFGPAYSSVWKETRSKITQIIYNGYPTDYSFAQTKKHGLALRRELEAEGVKFVICFLDENSSDNRLAMISNDDSARTYKFFVEKVLVDPTLGLVCKPGYPLTLRKRLSSISELLDAAVATKRCVFLDSGTYLTEKYPSEAAQAADICVALLYGGAAGMEANLAGTPTVFLNDKGFYSHPLYEIGKGRVVFDNINDLYRTIELFRTRPDLLAGFGDLSSWLHGRVAFRDGNAAERMGTYMLWLLEEFKIGRSREEAISLANKRFISQWGVENIEFFEDFVNPLNITTEGHAKVALWK